MRLWKLLTVLPLALMLAACLQTSRPSAGQASVVVAAAAPLPGVDSEDEGYVQMAALNSFPSSASPARGTPWKTMHRDGNRASFQENCDLLGLTPSACRQYSEKLDRNQCVTMTLPNGVILDRLTFTRNGRHQAQRSVLVAITNVPANHLDRTATVCDIGGVYVGRIHGCGNYFRVDARGAAPPVVIAPVPQVRVDGACAPSRRDGSMRLCLQAFWYEGLATRLECKEELRQNSRNVPPDMLRSQVRLFTEAAPMHFVIKKANIGQAQVGATFVVPTARGTVVFRVNQRRDLETTFPFSGEETLYVPPALRTDEIQIAAWSDHPLLVKGYPQRCDCESDGYGSFISNAKGGAMRTDRNDGLGAKMLQVINNNLPTGMQDRMVFSFVAATAPRR